jgi:hypothetical protein
MILIKKNLASYCLSSVCAELGNLDWIYNYARILFFKIAPSGICGEWEVSGGDEGDEGVRGDEGDEGDEEVRGDEGDEGVRGDEEDGY